MVVYTGAMTLRVIDRSSPGVQQARTVYGHELGALDGEMLVGIPVSKALLAVYYAMHCTPGLLHVDAFSCTHSSRTL